MGALTRCTLINPYVDVLAQVRHVGRIRADALEVTGERGLVGEDLFCKPLVQLALHRLVTLRARATGAKASEDYSGGVQDSHGAIVYIGLGPRADLCSDPLCYSGRSSNPSRFPARRT